MPRAREAAAPQQLQGGLPESPQDDLGQCTGAAREPTGRPGPVQGRTPMVNPHNLPGPPCTPQDAGVPTPAVPTHTPQARPGRGPWQVGTLTNGVATALPSEGIPTWVLQPPLSTGPWEGLVGPSSTISLGRRRPQAS